MNFSISENIDFIFPKFQQNSPKLFIKILKQHRATTQYFLKYWCLRGAIICKYCSSHQELSNATICKQTYMYDTEEETNVRAFVKLSMYRHGFKTLSTLFWSANSELRWNSNTIKRWKTAAKSVESYLFVHDWKETIVKPMIYSPCVWDVVLHNS